MNSIKNIGVIGGTGWQGGAIVRCALQKKFLQPKNLWLSNRSSSSKGFEAWPEITITTNNQSLVDHCDIIILSVRPQQFPTLHLDLSGKQVISLMAGVSIAKIQELTGAIDIIRCMPNTAAAEGLAYTGWVAAPGVKIKQWAQHFFESFGTADEFDSEDKINFCTALTGGGTGLIAYYQKCMIDVAIKQGFTEAQAEKAVKQLFHGSGVLYAKTQTSIYDIVKEFVDYAGTTAAGILKLKEAGLPTVIKEGLEAAYQKASTNMTAKD